MEITKNTIGLIKPKNHEEEILMPTIVETSVQQNQTCIVACNKCMQACEQCLTSCIKEPDAQARATCINLLRDCIDICALSARFMSRNSANSKQLCNLCATICDACAAECAKFQDTHCKQCADECHNCANECRKMAA